MPSVLFKLGLVVLLAIGASFAHVAHAEGEDWGAEPETVSVDDLDDAKIEAFAGVYQEIINIATEYEEKFVEAGDDPQEAARLQQEANEAMVQVIESEENISIEEYNVIVVSMRSDEELQNAVHEHMDS